MVTDHFKDKWEPYVAPPSVPPVPNDLIDVLEELVKLREEFRRDMSEMKKLLERARKYDKENGEPDCELKEKQDAIRKMAEHLGVEVDFL